MGARIADIFRLTVPLSLPAIGGLCYLYAYDAPARLLLINAGALAAAILWIVLGRWPVSQRVRLAVAATAALALFLPLVIGPEVGEVQRWLPAGPMMLHSGALLLPLITVLAAREAKLGPALFALASAALTLQSDAAALAGLAAASGVLAWWHHGALYAILAAVAAALAILTFGAGTLEPQAFTENVLQQVAERSLLQAGVLAVLLFAVPVWQLVTNPQTRCAEGYALAGLLIGLGLMATIAPFPYPLIGYGASPILGFGLALGAASRRHQHKAGKLFG